LLVTENSHDEVDGKLFPPSNNTVNNQVDQVQINITAIQLVDVSSTSEEIDQGTQCSEDVVGVKIPSRKTLSKPTEVSESKRSVLSAFKDVRPFTEQQLASLYHNQELTLVDAFITEFTDTQLRCGHLRQQHRLHELLMSYLRVRNHLVANSYELERLKKSCRETQKQLWCLEKTSTTESGECQDGNPVSATHEYSVAHFNQQTLVALSRTLSAIKETLHESQALYCYEAESLRLQIEHYVQRVVKSFNVSYSLLNYLSNYLETCRFKVKKKRLRWRGNYFNLFLTFRNSPTFRRLLQRTFCRSNRRRRRLRNWWSLEYA